MEAIDPKTIVGRQVPPPAEKIVSLKLNWRYGNVNAGEIAGYPESEARELLERKCPDGSGRMVAELNKRTAKD